MSGRVRPLRPAQAIAVDWSGREVNAGESIVLARARVADAELVEVTRGLGRDAVVDRLIELLAEEPHTIVGLDFGFSFPRWYLDERGWRDAPAAWAALAEEDEAGVPLADRLLVACDPPFWGRPGRGRPSVSDARPELRRTEAEIAGDPSVPGRPKSVFQIGGAGSVGTGSLRGMAHLARLRAAGARIWPYDAAKLPVVVEAWPRLSTGALRKGRFAERQAVARDLLQGQPPVLVERALGTEDAFDAAVTAVDMARAAYGSGGLVLEPARDERERLEGRIWRHREPRTDPEA